MKESIRMRRVMNREEGFPYQKIWTFGEHQKSQWVGEKKVQRPRKIHGLLKAIKKRAPLSVLPGRGILSYGAI